MLQGGGGKTFLRVWERYRKKNSFSIFFLKKLERASFFTFFPFSPQKILKMFSLHQGGGSPGKFSLHYWGGKKLPKGVGPFWRVSLWESPLPPPLAHLCVQGWGAVGARRGVFEWGNVLAWATEEEEPQVFLPLFLPLFHFSRRSPHIWEKRNSIAAFLSSPHTSEGDRRDRIDRSDSGFGHFISRQRSTTVVVKFLFSDSFFCQFSCYPSLEQRRRKGGKKGEIESSKLLSRFSVY